MSRPDPDTDLATLVRDAAPRPSAEFRERLDARVAERFDVPERPRRAWLGWPRWQLAGGLAAGCTLAGVVAIALSGSHGGDSDSASSVAARQAQTQTDAAQSAAGASARAPKSTATESQ